MNGPLRLPSLFVCVFRHLSDEPSFAIDRSLMKGLTSSSIAPPTSFAVHSSFRYSSALYRCICLAGQVQPFLWHQNLEKLHDSFPFHGTFIVTLCM